MEDLLILDNMLLLLFLLLLIITPGSIRNVFFILWKRILL